LFLAFALADFAVYETLRTNLPPSMKNANGDTTRTALFVCGATAGVVGQTVAYPLDLVRRRMQVQGFGGTQYSYKGGIFRTMAQIVKEEGVQGLYKGMVPFSTEITRCVNCIPSSDRRTTILSASRAAARDSGGPVGRFSLTCSRGSLLLVSLTVTTSRSFRPSRYRSCATST
jgi:hypothetical protein